MNRRRPVLVGLGVLLVMGAAQGRPEPVPVAPAPVVPTVAPPSPTAAPKPLPESPSAPTTSERRLPPVEINHDDDRESRFCRKRWWC